MVKTKCPVCGGNFLKGFALSSITNQGKFHGANNQTVLYPPSQFQKYTSNFFKVRSRVCSSCGHIDLYVHPDYLQKLVEFKANDD